MARAAHAQSPNATVSGNVLDQFGKPFPDITLIFVNDQGQKTEVTTDKNGHYVARNIRPGVYTVTMKSKDQQLYQFQVLAEALKEVNKDINFKDLLAKEGGAAAEAVKKQEEEKKKFEGMKVHFDAGVAALEQVKLARTELRSAPADQRDAAKQKLEAAAAQAITEFQDSQKTAPEKDPNLPLIWGKLGEAYDAAGKNEEAVDAYQKAIAPNPTKPEVAASHYNNLGNVYAKLGKIDDAKAAYQKSAELDPTNAAMAWRNFGIILTNLNRQKEAIEPLKKATELDPKNAQTWLLLGQALVNAMDYKKEGDKITPILLPGTVEAYQKVIELDPNGPWGSEARGGLKGLEAMGVGIETKMNTRKKKS
jgi:tetratricopeptide (TPR) repeat protein